MNSKIKKIFFILSGYQITWLFCIFGEYYKISIIGFIVGIIYLSLFFYHCSNKEEALKICLIFSSVGYIFDSLLGLLNIFTIKSNIMFGYLPIWFLVLWPAFSTLFVDVLSFLKNRPVVAFILGSLFAPLAYYSGIPLGIANSNNLTLAIIIMTVFWGSLLTFYSIYKNNK